MGGFFLKFSNGIFSLLSMTRVCYGLMHLGLLFQLCLFFWVLSVTLLQSEDYFVLVLFRCSLSELETGFLCGFHFSCFSLFFKNILKEGSFLSMRCLVLVWFSYHS